MKTTIRALTRSIDSTLAAFRLSSLVMFAPLVFSLNATDWPSWRGPYASGGTQEGSYPVQWTAANVAWKYVLPGKGGSSPIVWKEKIYLTTPAEGEDTVMAFDLSGTLLWQTRLGQEKPPKHRTLGSSCNSSPVTDGKGLFVSFKSGHFAAIDFDGKVRWKHNLTEKFGPENLYWDQGSSPVVTDEYVILTRMHEGESWVAGFSKATGEMTWRELRNYRTPRENDNGYTTPIVYEVSGGKAVLIWGADHLTAHDVVGGKLLWSCGGFNPNATGFWPAIASPVIFGNLAIVPVGRDDRPNQARVHGIRLGGSGDVTGTHREWYRDDLGVFVTSLTEYRGRIYLQRHRGGVVCIDPGTGKTIWSNSFPKHRSSYYASPVIANGIMYSAREDGTVFTAKVEDGFELLSENPMGERIVASPVPAANRLLLRGDQHLFCVAVQSKK